MFAPGQALPHVHMIICCPGATLPGVNFIAPGQVHRHLITMNLSEFFWFFTQIVTENNLELSGTFYWEICSKH